nr:uncharacterized protein LOC109167327 [Ipomoea batatas]
MANSSSSSDSNPEIPTNDLPDLKKLSDKVNNGLMLDRDGYLKHSTDRAVTKTFVKCFEHLWSDEELKGDQALVELKFSFKKKVLNPKFEWATDILSQIVENRVAVFDDVIVEEFSMLGAVLTNYNVDWSMVIYNSLRTKPHAPKGKGATLTKKKVIEEDFSSNLPLEKVTKKANAKRKLEVVEESMPKKAPRFPRHQNQRKSKKKAIEMSPVEGEHVRTAEPREVLASPARVVELTVQEDVETIFLGEDDREEETSRGVDVSVVIRIVREVSGNITETTEDSEATLDDPTTQQVKDDAQLAQQMADDTRKLWIISIPIATSIDEINQTYLRKVAEREEDKGKAKVTKEDVEIP